MSGSDTPERSYAISYHPSAAKELRKLDKQVARRIVRAVRKLSADPRPHGCRPLVGFDGLWRIRVGDYRVVYAIEEEDVIVIVVRIAHRREVYRTR